MISSYNRQISIAVSEVSQVGEARRSAQKICEGTNLSEVDQGRVAVVVTELATNLTRHTRGGEILLQVTPQSGGSSVEIVSIDTGPGMDMARCIEDGFSTAGTAGEGLGAVRRSSSVFDAHSTVANGTVVLSRVGRSAGLSEDLGVVSIPTQGEWENGDGWAVAESEGRRTMMVVDGLGHGAFAAEASRAALASFRDRAGAGEPKTFVEASHRALQGTRGAAIAFASIKPAARSIEYCGIGNISGTILGRTNRRGLCSHNGTAGVVMRKAQQFDYPFDEGSLLVMHSDGLQSRWDLEKYPGLASRHPAVIAAALYRDFRRGRDDSTVTVLRLPGSEVTAEGAASA